VKLLGHCDEFYEKSNSTQAKHIIQVLNLTIDESARGCQKEVRVTREKLCLRCNGSKAEPNKLQKCHPCNGRGKVYIKQNYFNVGVKCKDCNGSGVFIVDTCK